MPKIPDRLITYCSNIHPGETWTETFAALQEHVPRIKETVFPDKPFPIGLRLSAGTAADLTADRIARFAEWLDASGCFVPTINGFPFGSFHSQRVKENVYLPDWRHIKRVEYTSRLADILDTLIPPGIRGSISTVPVAFRQIVCSEDIAVIRHNLLRTLQHLDRLRQKSGKTIVLSLEPEPCCFLETTDELIRFIHDLDLPPDLADCLGICFDCCHHAIQFEDPAVSLTRLLEAGIPIGKVQVSSALSTSNPMETLLEGFVEERYLHQVVIRDANGGFARFSDLPEALFKHIRSAGEEWRVHFHLPVFLPVIGHYGTTQRFIIDALPAIPPQTLLEVETYTWDVLPQEHRTSTVTESIIRELQWLKGLHHDPHSRP